MLGKGAVFCGPSTPSVLCKRCLLTRKLPSPGKPPILPPAKSKMYNVSKYKWEEPADIADSLWRRHIYNNAILSMRRLFREEIALKKTFTVGLEEAKREEATELNTLLALNEERNRMLAEERVEREKEAVKQLELETLKEIEQRLEWEEQNAERRTREVLETIERSKTEFVSPENLERHILDALEHPTTFEYAIDLNGIKIENPVPDKYPHSVTNLPNIYKKPRDYGPPIEGYKYKKGRMGPPRPKGQPRNQAGSNKGGGAQGGDGRQQQKKEVSAATTNVVG